MSSTQRVLFWLGCFCATLILIFLLRGILLPFVAGMAIAYFLDPVVGRLRRIGVSRLLSTVVITLSFFALMVISLFLLIPLIEDQIIGFAHRVPDYVDAVSVRVEPLIHDLLRRLSPDDMERLRSSISGYAGTAMTLTLQLLRNVLTGGLAVVNVLSLIFITPIVTFYLLRDWNGLKCRIDLWLPRDSSAIIHAQLSEIDRTLAGFVRGQALVCLIMGIIYAVGLTVLGVDLGLVIGLAAGVMVFVPYLGHLTGLVISVGVAFAQTGQWSLPGDFVRPGHVFPLVAKDGGVLIRFAIEGYLQSPLYAGKPEAGNQTA